MKYGNYLNLKEIGLFVQEQTDRRPNTPTDRSSGSELIKRDSVITMHPQRYTVVHYSVIDLKHKIYDARDIFLQIGVLLFEYSQRFYIYICFLQCVPNMYCIV